MVKNIEKAEIKKEKKKAVSSRSRGRSPKQISARSLGIAKKSFSSSRIVAMTSKMTTVMSFRVTSDFVHLMITMYICRFLTA